MTEAEKQKEETKELAVQKKEMSDLIMAKIQGFQKKGEIDLPPGYSPNNAIKSAWLILQDVKDKYKNPALKVCEKHTVANALLDMVVQGLNPAKKQCHLL